MFSWISPQKYRLRAVGAVALLLVLAGHTMSFAQEAAVTEAAPAPAAETAAAPAEEAPAAPEVNSGDTAWLLTSTALVLFMTIPGLSLFYGGLVRKKNVLSVLIQCFALTALITVLWVAYGYSMAFATGGMEEGVKNIWSFVGNPLEKAFLSGVARDSVVMTLPESLFVVFQLTFAIITPALIVGAFAERMKFSAMLIFSAIWFTFSYLPICHMAWAGVGGLFWDWSVLDFAGGTVVHINAGIAALVACIIVGKRKGYPEKPMPPHNLALAVTGAGMLWVGWFGFNAGSAASAGAGAGYAMLVTQIATAVAALTWMFIEWIKNGKPSALGIITGAVAGLVAITPASGSSGVIGAFIIGFFASLICFFAATSLKKALGYDDSLDAFGVHGVGGVVGAMLTGVACAPALGGGGFGAGIETMGAQLTVQFLSVVVTVIVSGVVSTVALLGLKYTIGLRPTDDEEEQGLDLALHGEEGYHG